MGGGNRCRWREERRGRGRERQEKVGRTALLDPGKERRMEREPPALALQGHGEAGKGRGQTGGPRPGRRVGPAGKISQQGKETGGSKQRGWLSGREEQAEPHPTWAPRTHKCSKPHQLALTVLPPGDGRDLRLPYCPGARDTSVPPSALQRVCPATPVPKGLR